MNLMIPNVISLILLVKNLYIQNYSLKQEKIINMLKKRNNKMKIILKGKENNIKRKDISKIRTENNKIEIENNTTKIRIKNSIINMTEKMKKMKKL